MKKESEHQERPTEQPTAGDDEPERSAGPRTESEIENGRHEALEDLRKRINERRDSPEKAEENSATSHVTMERQSSEKDDEENADDPRGSGKEVGIHPNDLPNKFDTKVEDSNGSSRPNQDEQTDKQTEASLIPRHEAYPLDSTINPSLEQNPSANALLNDKSAALVSDKILDHEEVAILRPLAASETQPQTDESDHPRAGLGKVDPLINKNKSETNARNDSWDAKDIDVLPNAPSLKEKAENQTSAIDLKESQEKLVELSGPLFKAHEWRVGESHYLRIPRKLLTEYGKDDILEARVARASSPEQEFHLYTSSGYVEPHLNIAHLNPTRREPFNVLSLGKYEVPDFVRDFNNQRPEAFGNVTLSDSGGKVMMKVDGNLVEIKRPKLTVDGCRVILEGSLIETSSRGIIRIAKRYETFRLDFVDHARILYLKANGSNIEAGYRLSLHEPDHRTRQINALTVEPHDDRGGNDEVKHKLLGLDTSKMSKEEIRAWIDTEGTIIAGVLWGKRGVEISVTQKHREPLEAYVRGLAEMGVRCKIWHDKHGMYKAKIIDTEGAAKVISEVGPFRTPQKREQVRLFMEKLQAPRRVRRRVIERSKKLLGL